MEIIDDFLNPFQIKNTKKILFSEEIEWYYSQYTVHKKNEEEDNLDNYQFTHVFYCHETGTRSRTFDIITPIIEKLGVTKLIRAKANLNPRTYEPFVHEFHEDVTEVYAGAKSAIIYLNTNNGYTVFDDGTKVDSIENRALLFDSQQVHAGVTCTDQKVRIIISVVYF